MTKNKLYILAASIGVFLSHPAEAGYMFGKRQLVEKIQDIQLKGPQGEKLFLGHLVSTQFFLLGVWVKDDGYVLGVYGNGNGNKYYKLPEGQGLVEVQNKGLIPRPLPSYKLRKFDYLIGYSLWITIAVIVLWGLVKRRT